MNKTILNKEGMVNLLTNNIWDVNMETLPDEILNFIEYTGNEYYGYLAINLDTRDISNLAYLILDMLEDELKMIHNRQITLNLSYMPTVPFYIIYILLINMFDNYKNNGSFIPDLINRLTQEEIIAIIGDAFNYGDVSGKIYDAYARVADIEIDEDVISQIIDIISIDLLDVIKEYLVKIYISLLGIIKNFTTMHPNIEIGYAYTQLLKPYFAYKDNATPKTLLLSTLLNNDISAAKLPRNHRVSVNSLDIILAGGISNEKK